MSEQLPSGIAGAVDLSGLGKPKPEQGASGTRSKLVIDATEADFQQVVELSTRVPVIVDLWSARAVQSQQLSPVLEELVESYAGQLVLAKVDADSNPQLQQAFQAQSVPTVVALIGGRPAPLFAGDQPKEQIKAVFDQVLQIAAQEGITGRLPTDDAHVEQSEEETEKPLPPLHQKAYDALQAGDFDAAGQAYDKALQVNPGDFDASAGRAQVRLLQRLQGKSLDDIRAEGAAAPDDLEKQMLVADLDLSGGHVDDAFGRLLDLFPGAGDQKDAVRSRLLELFEIVGNDDARVNAARRRLTLLLY